MSKMQDAFVKGLLRMVTDRLSPEYVRNIDLAAMPFDIRQMITAFAELHNRSQPHHQNEIISKHEYKSKLAAVADAMAEDGDAKFDRSKYDPS